MAEKCSISFQGHILMDGDYMQPEAHNKNTLNFSLFTSRQRITKIQFETDVNMYHFSRRRWEMARSVGIKHFEIEFFVAFVK